MTGLAQYVLSQLGFLPFTRVGPRRLRPDRPALAFRRGYYNTVRVRSNPLRLPTESQVYPRNHRDVAQRLRNSYQEDDR